MTTLFYPPGEQVWVRDSDGTTARSIPVYGALRVEAVEIVTAISVALWRVDVEGRAMTGAQCWRELPAIVCPGPRCRMKIGRRVDRIEPPKPIAENGGRVADLRGLIVLIGSTPILPDRISAMWDRTRQRAGIPNVRLHDLRHWAATTMLDAGVPLPVVTERLGHASGAATTLRVYAHSTRAADKNAADMLAGRLNPIP